MLSRQKTQKKLQVFAIIRIDADIETVKDAVAVTEILPTLDQAEREVERLNQLNAAKRVRYFLQATRYFPEGRKPG